MRAALLLPLLFGLVSCSSYQRDFRAAAKKHSPSASPAGPWKGTWKSTVNGHSGPLWCLVSRDEKDPAYWNFRYRAGWGVLQFGDYTHRVVARQKRNGSLPLKGTMTLPNNFGTYTVDGVLTPTEFGVTYTGSDRGSMNLVRP